MNFAGYGLTAMNADGSPAALAITGRVANLGQAGSTITIKGGTAAGSSGELGGAILIAGGDGAAGSANTPGAVTVHGGDGQGAFDYVGGALTLRGGSGGGGSGGSGADVILASGNGGNLDGKVILEGNSDHSSPGSAGIHLRLQNADLRVSTDGGATSTPGVTEDVVVGDGAAGTLTLHFVKGIYTGHTGP